MQTFLPYPSIVKSLQCLDYRRLGKQRVEAMQLVNSTLKLERGEKVRGWANHPARTMWNGYLPALKLYHNLSIDEWVRRGYNNTMKHYDLPDNIQMPPWFGWEKLHASHRSNLLRKDPVWYGQFGWSEPDNIEYVWPTRELEQWN